MNVTGQAISGFFCIIRNAIDADIDYNGPRLYHLIRHKFRSTDRDNEHVGQSSNGGKIVRARMANSHSCIRPGAFLEGKQRDGFADDQRAAEHDDVFTGQINAASRE